MLGGGGHSGSFRVLLLTSRRKGFQIHGVRGAGDLIFWGGEVR